MCVCAMNEGGSSCFVMVVKVAVCAEVQDQWVKAIQDAMSVASHRLHMQRHSVVSWYSTHRLLVVKYSRLCGRSSP